MSIHNDNVAGLVFFCPHSDSLSSTKLFSFWLFSIFLRTLIALCQRKGFQSRPRGFLGSRVLGLKEAEIRLSHFGRFYSYP